MAYANQFVRYRMPGRPHDERRHRGGARAPGNVQARPGSVARLPRCTFSVQNPRLAQDPRLVPAPVPGTLQTLFAMTAHAPPSPWMRIFLPFALGYYLSYLLRTVNAVISPDLTRELALSSADLGLLTSAYFLTFGLAQIPLGIALDRFGPRVVEGGLLLLTSLGAVAFALGDSLGQLGMARGLIGLGVSACLMAGLKGFAMWYPAERQSSMTGFIMAAGALGALTASAPVEAMLPILGWRGVFWVIAVVALAVAVFLLFALPREKPHASGESVMEAFRSVGVIFTSAGFWRFAASAVFITGGFMAFQSLWAVPWLMDVNGLSRAQAATQLLVMNLGMLAGQLSIGFLGTRLARMGVRPVHLLQGGFSAMLVVELLILMQWGPISFAWFALGVLVSVNAQAYLAASDYFPKSAFGRVSTAVNLMVFAGAFAVQWGLGGMLDLLQGMGSERASALQMSYAGLMGVQLASLMPILLGGRRAAVGGR